MKYKGHVKGTVKMQKKKKPLGKGFKIWCCCCTCCGYLCSFKIYEDKPINPITGKSVSEKGNNSRIALQNIPIAHVSVIPGTIQICIKN